MIKTFYLQAIAFWIVLVFVAISNAILREAVYGPIVNNELLSHQISTLTGILLLSTGYYFFLKFIASEYAAIDTIYLGVMWMIMTICFEFLFGHFVMGNSWAHLFNDYNILAGRVWIFEVVSILIGPYLMDRFLLK